MLNELTAITSIDGRYRRKVQEVAQYYSEFGLMKYRVRVEIEYFIALVDLGLPNLASFPKSEYAAIRKIYQEFTEEDALSIKTIEKTTNHDVKAVEYFIKDKFRALDLGHDLEFIHFGLTSQDINNTSIPLSLKEGLQEVVFPLVRELIDKLNALKSQVEKEFLKEADHINQNFHKQLKTLEGKHKEEHDNLVEQIFFKITSEE